LFIGETVIWGGFISHPIPPLSFQNRAHMRQGISLSPISLNNQPRLAGWILKKGPGAGR
jgi:hypothetical protein